MFQAHSPSPFRRRLAVLVLSATVAATSLPLVGETQSDGTDADSQSPSTECVIYRAETLPVVQVATPVVAAEGTSIATPVATTAATPIATPFASPSADLASPIADTAATPVPDGVPVDPNTQVQIDIEASVDVLIDCLNEGEYDIFSQITSDAVRGAMFGVQDPLSAEVFIGLAQTLPETERTVVSVSEFTRVDETTVWVTVVHTKGNQLMTEVWTFVNQTVDGLPSWMLDSIAPADPAIPEGAATIDVTIADGAYTLSVATVSSPDVVLEIQNTSTSSEHEALVLMIPADMQAEELLQASGGALPEGVTLIGQASFAPGGKGSLVLVDLEPGTYTIVDLLPNAEGQPNLSTGMTTSFTVEN